MEPFRVQSEVFEGPMDLLLYLVRKEEVDIHEVNLARLANEFIEYVELMRQLDLEIAGEFLVMAATMVYIKSKELLPAEERSEETHEEEENSLDPRYELIRQLVEYKKFKDAASKLQHIEGEQEFVYERAPYEMDLGAPPYSLRQKASALLLIQAVNRIMKRHEKAKEIEDDQWTVGDQLERVATRVANEKRFRFSHFISANPTQLEVVTAFLAILELIRLRQIDVEQSENFEDIDIVAVESEEESPEGAGAGESPERDEAIEEEAALGS